MNFAISWVLGLFRKPEVEVTFDKVQIKPAETWPFPVETKKRKTQGKKPAVKKVATKKPIAKKTTKVVKKATKKAK
jgi:hypothetical protein